MNWVTNISLAHVPNETFKFPFTIGRKAILYLRSAVSRDNRKHTSAGLFMSAETENRLFIAENVTLGQRNQRPSQTPSPMHIRGTYKPPMQDSTF